MKYWLLEHNGSAHMGQGTLELDWIVVAFLASQSSFSLLGLIKGFTELRTFQIKKPWWWILSKEEGVLFSETDRLGSIGPAFGPSLRKTRSRRVCVSTQKMEAYPQEATARGACSIGPDHRPMATHFLPRPLGIISKPPGKSCLMWVPWFART